MPAGRPKRPARNLVAEAAVKSECALRIDKVMTKFIKVSVRLNKKMNKRKWFQVYVFQQKIIALQNLIDILF